VIVEVLIWWSKAVFTIGLVWAVHDQAVLPAVAGLANAVGALAVASSMLDQRSDGVR
jgi:hypothetical protein